MPSDRPESISSVAAPGDVRPGVEVLLASQLGLIEGKRLGLVTNQTGQDRQGRSTIDLLFASAGSELVALFAPEHGLRGESAAGEVVGAGVDAPTGLPIFSLYGETTRPTPAMLQGVDMIVFDIQDAGARVYTYAATLAEVLRAGAAHGVSVVVLDRPNPINGVDVEGNVLDPAFTSFVGPAPLPMRHGLTIGELGHYFNAELAIGADFTVVPMVGWQRQLWYDQTGLRWVNPSPNLRSLGAATLYPGTVLVEGTNLSEGRGTDRPFEWVGAPWIDSAGWADRLNRADLPGVRFRPMTNTPMDSKFAGEPCGGVLVEIANRDDVRPMALGVAIVAAARELAPDRFSFTPSFDLLAGTDRVRVAIEAAAQPGEIENAWRVEMTSFRERRERYLLY